MGWYTLWVSRRVQTLRKKKGHRFFMTAKWVVGLLAEAQGLEKELCV